MKLRLEADNRDMRLAALCLGGMSKATVMRRERVSSRTLEMALLRAGVDDGCQDPTPATGIREHFGEVEIVWTPAEYERLEAIRRTRWADSESA